MTDTNGRILNIGNEVFVPEPNKSDSYLSEFFGTIADILGSRVTVINEANDYIEVDADRVSVLQI